MSRKKRKKHAEVELNLAAMLDMAFQLLTFFILTFKPGPVEGEISLRLPPPKPIAVVKEGQAAGSNENNSNPLKGFESLIVSVLPGPNGNIGSLAIDESGVPNIVQLGDRLHTILQNPATKFEQVIIQVGSGLRYDALMAVVDVCTKQTLRNGEKLTKLSFVELPDGPPGN